MFGGLGGLLPFLPLVLDDRGLTGKEIGGVLTLVVVCTILIPPIWGAAADSRFARGKLLAVAALGTGLTLLLFIPRWGFAGSLAAMAAICFFRSPLIPLVDASTRSTLAERPEDYGKVRVWGSIGFAVAVTVVGVLEGATHATLLFIGLAMVHGLAALLATRLDDPGEPEPPRWADGLRHLSDPRLLALLLATAVYYVGHATFDGFFALHLRALGYSEALFGVAWAVGVTAEIAIMPATGALVRRFGTPTLLTLSAVLAAARWWAIAAVADPIVILLIQPAHAMTFGVWYVSLFHAVQDRSPDNLRSSMQAIAIAAMGVGRMVAFLVGGWLLDAEGTAVVFEFAAIATLLSLLAYRWFARLDRRTTTE